MLHEVPYGTYARCEKIRHHLQPGSSFKVEGPINKLWLLPDFWHGMLPVERKAVVSIIDAHGAQYTDTCVWQLNTVCNVPFSDMPKLRSCYDISKESPETTELTPAYRPMSLLVSTPEEAMRAKVAGILMLAVV